MLDFVADLDRCGLREAALKLASETSALLPLTTAPPAAKQRVTKKGKPPAPLGFTLRGIDHSHPYLASRGIQTATAERFGIGLYRGSGIFSGRLVIPIHNERGELVAYCGRASDASPPRYRFPSGFAKSEILFNLHRAVATGHQAVVVEGFFDCLKLHQAGVPAVVALMGAASYHSQQRPLLRHFRSLILMLDGDTSGRYATATIAAQLRPHVPVRVIRLPDQVSPTSSPPKESEKSCRRRARRLTRSADRSLGAGMPPAAQVTERENTARRILLSSVRYGFPTQPAFSVRGSSGRIMTMRFRPADIRVINRRKMPLVPSPALRPHGLSQRLEGVDNDNS